MKLVNGLLSLLVLCGLLLLLAAKEPCTVGKPCPFGLVQRTVDISAAQILDSYDTPVVLVPAPGAGYVVVPISMAQFVGSGDAYTHGLGIYWDGDGSSIWNISTTAEFESRPPGDISETLAAVEGKALVFRGADGIGESGAVGAVSVANGGADYEIGDTGTITAGAENAEYEVDAVDMGAVTALTITSGGWDYVEASGVATTTSGMGSGLTLDIDSIALGSRPVSITVVYSVVRVPR